jgi:hypothetical protein
MRRRITTSHERERELIAMQAEEARRSQKPNGGAAAAILAAAIGVLAIGILTTLSEASEPIHDFLNWYNPTGPLSGKTGLGSIIWLISWGIGYVALSKKEVNLPRMVKVAAILMVIGLLLLFPPIFTLFATE